MTMFLLCRGGCKLSNLLFILQWLITNVPQLGSLFWIEPKHVVVVVATPHSGKGKAGGLKKLIRQVQSDSEDDMPPNAASTSAGDPLRPWIREFLSYIETLEAALPAGMSTIQWWGVSIVYYPPRNLLPDHIILRSMHRVPGLGITCSGLFIDHVVISLKWTWHFQVWTLLSVSDGIGSRGI